MPEDNKKKISVKDAAEIMGKSQQFVRIGLQRGLLPFGTAVKMSSMWTYYISPKQFHEYVGDDEQATTKEAM
ncbi:hypothetical protein SAMN05660297_02782 [Natronincola peptidivorans]|uniref:Helix-turn-helix domain-containing protein n=1 Tax=Natronincola peptidivorans TaxID=426128 RepID=A0A1I0FGR7_9FIRM|nr:hypothetical protein [Natronincola peptidivorans]SET56404.1 hypothetical protein SAMN05660297_02782 [Natronincola peptidivorans]